MGSSVLRINFFCGSTHFSGGRLVIFEQAAELRRRGHEVTIHVTKDPHCEWFKGDVTIRQTPWEKWGELPGADLCIFESPKYGRGLYRSGRGIPVHLCQRFEPDTDAYHLKECWQTRGVRSLPRWIKVQLRRQRDLAGYRLPIPKIVIHPHLQTLLMERFGQKSWYVHNGIPMDLFYPAPGDKPVNKAILVVGATQVRCKRVADALAAAALLKKQMPGVRLVRVSSMPMEESEKLAGITDEYHQAASRQKMGELYRQCSVTLVPYDPTEGFGLPVIESMACGTPVVCSDIPAFRGFAAPDDYALFAATGDCEAMSRQIVRLLTNAELRDRVRARGLQVAREYSWQQAFDDMERVLREIRQEYAGQFCR